RYLARRGIRTFGKILSVFENFLVAAVLDDLVLYFSGRFVGGIVRREIVQLEEDAELFFALEHVVHAGPDLPTTDHERTGADAAGRHALDHVGQHQGAGSDLFGVQTRDRDRLLVAGHVAADQVFADHIQAVGARRERHSLLIDALLLGVRLKHLGR